jgi:hypothetical protein
MICGRKQENRIAVAIGAAYMNNGMAIVLKSHTGLRSSINGPF